MFLTGIVVFDGLHELIGARAFQPDEQVVQVLCTRNALGLLKVRPIALRDISRCVLDQLKKPTLHQLDQLIQLLYPTLSVVQGYNELFRTSFCILDYFVLDALGSVTKSQG